MDQQEIKQLSLLLLAVKSSAALLIPTIVFLYKKEMKRKVEMTSLKDSIFALKTSIISIQDILERVEKNIVAMKGEILFTQKRVARIPKEINDNGLSNQ